VRKSIGAWSLVSNSVAFIGHALFAITLGFSPTVARSDGETIPPDAFLPQYRRILKEHEATYRNIRIEGRTRFRRSSWAPPGKGEATKVVDLPLSERPWMEFTYCLSDGNCKLATSFRNGDHYTEGAEVRESRHFFRVRRTSPGGPYSLTESREENDAPRVPTESPGRVKEAPYCPWGYSDFPSYVSSPDFKIRDVSGTDDSARGRVKVTFSYRPTDRQNPVAEGWVRLDPNANWVLTDYEIRSIRPASAKKVELVTQSSGAIRYTQSSGLAVPVEVKFKNVLQSRKGNTEEEGEYQVDHFSVGPTPTEEFTLAAFGLGDFEAPSGRSANRFGYYAMAVAVAAALISLILSRLGKARRSEQAKA